MDLQAIGALLAGIGALAGGIAQLIEALGKKQGEDAESGMGGSQDPPRRYFPGPAPVPAAC